MDSHTDVRDIAKEALNLVRSKITNNKFSDYQRTPLINHTRDISKLLIDEFGCEDKAIIVTAMTGDFKSLDCVDHQSTIPATYSVQPK